MVILPSSIVNTETSSSLTLIASSGAVIFTVPLSTVACISVFRPSYVLELIFRTPVAFDSPPIAIDEKE